MSAVAARLVVRGVTKSFGATQALRAVNLDVAPGSVHALIGENGAGKSTLMKVLAGVHRPDGGSIEIGGEPYAPRAPREARTAGVAMIHQELAIAPDLSVEANIHLGAEQARWGWVRRAEQRRAARNALARLGHPDLDLDSPAGELPLAQQQLVEIARALVSRARILILDEPTSSLGEQDTRKLFAVVRELAAEGLTVLYISHFLEEVAEVCDAFTVLRDGATVAKGPMEGTALERIVGWMVGRELDELFPKVPHAIGAPLLRVRALAGSRLPRRAELTLHRGEVLGIAGLIGAGRSELLRCLYGLDPIRAGSASRVASDGSETPLGSGARASVARGLGLVSEDRKGEGLYLGLDLAENLTATRLEAYSRCGWLRLGRRDRAVREHLERIRCKARGPQQLLSELSGGNQQKVAFARLLHQDAEILLLDEPTRGIDVGTKAEIYRLIGELAAAGKGLILVSSYLPELFGVCDSLAVMCRGELSEIRPVTRWTHEEVMQRAVGA